MRRRGLPRPSRLRPRGSAAPTGPAPRPRRRTSGPRRCCEGSSGHDRASPARRVPWTGPPARRNGWRSLRLAPAHAAPRPPCATARVPPRRRPAVRAPADEPGVRIARRVLRVPRRPTTCRLRPGLRRPARGRSPARPPGRARPAPPRCARGDAAPPLPARRVARPGPGRCACWGSPDADRARRHRPDRSIAPAGAPPSLPAPRRPRGRKGHRAAARCAPCRRPAGTQCS